MKESTTTPSLISKGCQKQRKHESLLVRVVEQKKNVGFYEHGFVFITCGRFMITFCSAVSVLERWHNRDSRDPGRKSARRLLPQLSSKYQIYFRPVNYCKRLTGFSKMIQFCGVIKFIRFEESIWNEWNGGCKTRERSSASRRPPRAAGYTVHRVIKLISPQQITSLRDQTAPGQKKVCVWEGSPLWGVEAAVGWVHSLHIPALREP